MTVHLFPFDLIPKGSAVVLYGAGNVGREYIEQIEQTKWCKVSYIADRDYKRYKWMHIPVCDPEELFCFAEYDYVVIAIEAIPVTEQITGNLKDWGVPAERIVNVSGRYFEYSKQNEAIDYGETPDDGGDVIRIAFQMVGSMGTYIIYLRLFEEIIRICPDCMIDIYGKAALAEYFYKDHPNVCEIKDYNQLANERENYDVILKVGHVVRLEKMLFAKVKKCCPELAEKLKRNHEEFTDYYCNLSTQHCMDNTFIRKSGFLGINRYTALGHNGVFDLSDKKSVIRLDTSYDAAFKNLHLGKYFTFNRGAAAIPGEDREQTKLWPQEYYYSFITGFKQAFPDIEAVQIGSGDLEKLTCASRHYMGENMELVKYILKNSVFHLDCEGGLVHLATQLGTKCIVLFGPTSIQYFGYEQNINIATAYCGDCRWIAPDWMVQCYRGKDKNICMKSITPEMVLEKAKSVIQKQQ